MPSERVQFAAMTTEKQEITSELAELATILAAGLQRLLQRKSSQISPVKSETPLDCEATSGGHVRRKFENLNP